MGRKDCCYRATTIMALRIIESMRTFYMDADSIQSEFIGKIGDYEREVAKAEGIEIYDSDYEGSE